MTTTATTPAIAPAKAEAHGRVMSRKRSAAVWTLLVLASIITLLSTLTLWVNRQLLDNGEFRRANAKIIRDPKVQSALATFMVNQLYDSVNVQQSLEQRLPTNLKQLAAPLATALRQPATNAAEALIRRPRFQQLYLNLSGIAHQKLVNVLENKTGYGIDTGNGVVTLNLHSFITELGTELGVPKAALDRIPANAGTLTIMRSDQLSSAQTGVRLIRVLSSFLLILVLVLLAAAIYIARGARRVTLRNAGWAFVVVGLVLLILRRVIGNYALDALASPGYRGTIHDVWIIGTEILGQIGVATVIYGAVAVAAAIFAGPTRIATRGRREIAPVLNQRPELVGFAAAGVFLVLILWGPTHALRTWWGILLLAGLVALGIYALRRQTLVEFPPGAEAAVVLAKEAPAAGAAGAAAPRSTADELAELAKMRDAGVISDEEFARAKELALS
jgi:hypothetical protein